jgi:hypothetical protein
MDERWSGDGTFYLPARQVEPYRLWFEFLKQAHRDAEIQIDHSHYAEWGDFADKEFGEWWGGPTWRRLFAVDAGVRVLEQGEHVESDAAALTVRLPLNKDPKETLRDVEQLLEQHKASVKLSDVVQGKFALSAGYEKAFLKYLSKVRIMLRCYTYWLDHQDLEGNSRVNTTVLSFYNWAKTRDGLIVQRGYKYNRPEIPYAVGELARSVLAGETPDQDHRRAFMRYLQKARNLSRNAAQGVFPGRY